MALVMIKKSSGDNACLILKSWSTCYIFGDTDLFVKNDTADKIYIQPSGQSITFKSNISGHNSFQYAIVCGSI